MRNLQTKETVEASFYCNKYCHLFYVNLELNQEKLNKKCDMQNFTWVWAISFGLSHPTFTTSEIFFGFITEYFQLSLLNMRFWNELIIQTNIKFYKENTIFLEINKNTQ